MEIPRTKNLRLATLVYASIAICSLLGCEETGRGNAAAADSEQSRVTSPGGELDAVLIREDGGGAPGGWEWYVYIVPKGKPVEAGAREVFNAGTLTGYKLVWAHENLLEVHYDIASISGFRNLWALGEVQKVASNGDYLVEVRLVPAREFSILNPDGGYRHRE